MQLAASTENLRSLVKYQLLYMVESLLKVKLDAHLLHYTVINEFSNSGEEFVLILEDDALIEEGFPIVFVQ